MALTTTWQGATGASWVAGGSWTSGVPTLTDTASFPSTGGAGDSTSTAGPANVAVIQFNRTANSFTINSTPLTLGTGAAITDTASNAVSNVIASASLVLNDNLSITCTQSASGITISSLISESVALRQITINTAASVNLTGTGSTFTGGVNTVAGSLNVGSSTALGSGTVTMAGGTTLRPLLACTGFSNSISLTGGTVTLTPQSGSKVLSGAITETAPTTISQTTGTITFSNPLNNYSGGTTISAGTLTAGAVNVFGTGAISLTASTATLNLNGFSQSVGGISSAGTTQSITLGSGVLTTNCTTGGPFTFNGAITGTGGITLSGSGILIFSGIAKGYTGSTIIQGGELRAGIANVIGSSSALTLSNVAGVLFNPNSLNQSVGTLSGGGNLGGNITLGSATLTVTQGSNQTYDGVISDTGGLTKAGSSRLTLSRAQTYTGATAIQAGSLQAGIANVISNSSSLALSNVAGAVFDLNSLNQSIATLSGGGNLGGNITLGSATLTVTQGSDQTYGGVISDTGNLIKAGSSALALSQASTYTGTTSIQAGKLQAAVANIISNSSSLTLSNVAGAVFDLNSFNQSVGTLSGGGNLGGNITLGSATLTVTQGSNQTYDGVISDTGGLTKAGSSRLTLSRVETYTGATAIQAGSLQAGIANVISSSSSLALSNVAGAVFDLNNLNQSIGTLSGGGNLGGNITLGSATLTVTQGSDQTYGGVISDTGNLIKAGSFTLAISQASTYTGTTSIQAGSLQASVANIISNSSSLTLSDVAGAVFDLNSFDQSIATLSGGGSLGGNITLGSATLTVTQGSNQTYDGVISGAGGLTKAGASRLTLSRVETYTGATAIQAGSLQAGIADVISSSSSLALSNVAGAVFDLNSFNQSVGTLSGGGNLGGNITLGSATLTVTQGSNQTYDGVISDTGGLTKAGSSRLTLSRAQTYTGDTSIQAGSLQAGIANVISNSSSLTLSNVAGAVFDLNSLNQSIATLSGGGNLGGNITLGSAILTVTQGSDQTYGGAVSESGQLFKQGGSKLTLTGTNSYTGLTTVAAGTLQGDTSSLPGNIDNYSTLIWNQTSAGTYSHNITQSMGLGAMQVQGGGLLTTTGALTQDTITVLSGGSMALDGTATVTTLTVNSGGSLIGTGSVTGNVDVFGTLGAGNSIGTLTVTGNYTQESGSIFAVEIIPTEVDLLEVSNTITLGDHVATFSLMPTIGDYPANQQYTVMHGAGGISGRFIEPITSSLPSFNATLHYTPIPSLMAEDPSMLGDPSVLYVVLLVNTVTPSNLPVSPTALIAARCFDAIPNNPFAEYLLFMQIPQMNMTLTQMLPSAFGGLDMTQQDLITQVREVATREMNLFLKNPCGVPQRFRVWTDIFIPRAVQHCRHNQMGYYSSALGEALGFDYQINPGSFFGFFAAYAQNHMRGKSADIDGWTHNVYGNLYAGGWISSAKSVYAQAVLSGSYNHYHTVRSIYFSGEQFNPFTEKPRAHFHGGSGLGSFEIGKLWKRVCQNQLYGRVDYSFGYRNRFTENQASSLNLEVKGHFSDFIRMELGDAIARCATLQNTLFDARLAAGGVLEYQINGKKQKASFMDTSCVMTADGPTLGRAFLFWELGVQIHISKNYLDVISGNFRGEYGSGFVSHNWSVELKSSF